LLLLVEVLFGVFLKNIEIISHAQDVKKLPVSKNNMALQIIFLHFKHFLYRYYLFSFSLKIKLLM